MRPLLLRPDNFTASTRTPWGGTRLLGRYKAGLGLVPGDPQGRVGESWELSVADELPSQVWEDGGARSLAEALRADPRAALGFEAALGRDVTALLVKWLDADDDLSLQIHPRDDYEGLAAGEAGKVEAWYVIEAAPGAGFYFGLKAGVREGDVRAALASGDLRQHLCFVPAEAGDVALIEPGVPHAVGRGLLLLEPQRVVPGQRALTYRYWDFDRRYDAAGRPDPAGTPRPLHLEHALAVTAFAEASDAAWLARKRGSAGAVRRDAPAHRTQLLGDEPAACVRSDALCVERLAGQGALELPAADALRALTVIEGEVRLRQVDGEWVVRAGTTAALPAATGALGVELSRAHALLCSVLR